MTPAALKIKKNKNQTQAHKQKWGCNPRDINTGAEEKKKSKLSLEELTTYLIELILQMIITF